MAFHDGLIMSDLQVRLLIDCNFESAVAGTQGLQDIHPVALSPLLPSPKLHGLLLMMSAATDSVQLWPCKRVLHCSRSGPSHLAPMMLSLHCFAE